MRSIRMLHRKEGLLRTVQLLVWRAMRESNV